MDKDAMVLRIERDVNSSVNEFFPGSNVGTTIRKNIENDPPDNFRQTIERHPWVIYIKFHEEGVNIEIYYLIRDVSFDGIFTGYYNQSSEFDTSTLYTPSTFKNSADNYIVDRLSGELKGVLEL